MIQQRIRGGLWFFAVLVALAGIGASLYLTIHHYRLLLPIAGKTICNVNAYINCDAVLTSRYAVLGTLPLSGLGLLFYIYLSGALLYARVAPENWGSILYLPWLLSGAAVVLSLFLAYLSFFELQSLCLFCASLYLVNLLAFIVLGILLGRGEIMKFRIPLSSLAYLLIVFVAGGILLHTSTRQYAKDLSEAETQQYLTAFFAQPSVAIDTAGRPYWGNPDAKIIIAEFSDLECPYCKVAAFRLKPFLSEYKDKVKLVFLNYPLDKSCNPEMSREMHVQACRAATALYCASEQGKFWEYHDEAFARQPKFSEESLKDIAKKIGLAGAAFQACLHSEAAKNYVAADVAQGNRIGVQSTPSIYINGKNFPNWISKRLLHRALDKISSEKP